MRIIVLEHDPAFGNVLKIGLKAQGGHSVDSYTTAAEALAAIKREEYSLALVEYTVDGREFLYKYRESDPLLTVVILTAMPTQETAVEFLRGGAQALAVDYIIKPTPDLIRQLAVIIDTHFARAKCGQWQVDRKTGVATYRDEPVSLTPTQLILFTYFILHPYEMVRHEELWLAVSGEELEHEEAVRRVRTQLSRLRDRLEEVAGREVIQMHREKGFRFLPETVSERLAGEAGIG